MTRWQAAGLIAGFAGAVLIFSPWEKSSELFSAGGLECLAASVSYNINDWMSVALDAMNLNSPKFKYYTVNPAYGRLPYAFYDNGRQYYVNLRFKF